MLKRLFVIFSVIIVTFHLFVMVLQFRQEYLFSLYLAVNVRSNEDAYKGTDYERDIERIAKEQDSLVAKRIGLPSKDGRPIVVYLPFGVGTLPSHLPLATEEQSMHSAKTGGSYLIVRGRLQVQEFRDTLKSLGYMASYHPATSHWVLAISAISGWHRLLLLVIFVIAYASIVMIYRINELRNIGIRVVSGETMLSIIRRSFINDTLEIVIPSILAVFVSLFVMLAMGQYQLDLLLVLICGLVIYGASLLLASIFLSVVYIIGSRKCGLIPLIKGRRHHHILIGTLLIGQLLSFIIIGYSFGRIVSAFGALQEQSIAMEEWSKVSDRYLVLYTAGSDIGLATHTRWRELIVDAVEHWDAMLVKHNLALYMSKMTAPKDVKLMDYHPDGRVLYVTENYFDKQGIALDPAFKEQLSHLKPGEFGILLPEKLRGNADKYISMFEGNAGAVAFVEDGTSYFMYNHTTVSTKQWLEDPIIVVYPPCFADAMTTEEANAFWGNMLTHYTFFKGYDKTISLLKKHDLFQQTARVVDSSKQYLIKLNSMRQVTIEFLFGIMLVLFSTVVLFGSTHALYFEQYRRDIFIKKISGLKLWESHYTYFALQLIVMMLAFSVALLFVRNIYVILFTLLLCLIASLVVFVIYANRENKYSVSIIKGE